MKFKDSQQWFVPPDSPFLKPLTVLTYLAGVTEKISLEQLIAALKRYREIGVNHIALQFMVGRWPEHKAQIERFGQEVIPALREN